jgi:uncharacterized membrane protein
MRSRQISFRISWKLFEELEQQVKARGIKNLSRLMVALCSLAVLDHRRSRWITDLANADPKDQEFAIEHMLTWPKEFREMLKLMRRMDKMPKPGPDD